MLIRSNGFFLTRNFDIDTNEDIDFSDIDGMANLMVWGYDELINDLDIFCRRIGEDDSDNLVYNCYVEFSKKEKFYFVISFYSFDEEWLDKPIVDKIREIEQEIRIEINTEEEIQIFKNKVTMAVNQLGFKNIKEVFEEE